MPRLAKVQWLAVHLNNPTDPTFMGNMVMAGWMGSPDVPSPQEPVEREEDVCRETEPAKSLEEERRQQFMQARVFFMGV